MKHSGVCFVLLLALLIRVGFLLLTPDAMQADPDGYRRLATNLVEYGTFGNGDTPTAFRPPLSTSFDRRFHLSPLFPR